MIRLSKQRIIIRKSVLLICILCLLLFGCGTSTSESEQNYGVFLSVTYDSLPRERNYDTLVIDAQYFTKEEIQELHGECDRIYSYLNVGAIEDFRDYYNDWERVFLGDYEHWSEEKFVDVSDEEWRNFLISITAQLQDKGIDGLFLDNLDVYDEYPSEEMYDGITEVLKVFKKRGLDLVVNGGDVYVTEYLSRENQLSDLIDGVNQEGVYTYINWEEDRLEPSATEERDYFLDYLQEVDEAGVEVFLLEYTKDRKLARQIQRDCRTLGYTVYISDSVELD